MAKKRKKGKQEDEQEYEFTPPEFDEKAFSDAELEQLEATRAVWDLESVSESPTVYRAQYLAFKLLEDLKARQAEELNTFRELPMEEIVPTGSAPRSRASNERGPRRPGASGAASIASRSVIPAWFTTAVTLRLSPA